nr:hypothetical protein SHINE37_70049 [Rhizobiaceae bacterium]
MKHLSGCRDNHLRHLSGNAAERLAEEPPARQGRVGDKAQSFADEVVNDSKKTEAETILEGIADEFQLQRSVCVTAKLADALVQKHASTAAHAHRQFLLTIETPKLLHVNDNPMSVQHEVDAPLTETAALRRNLPNRMPNGLIVTPHAAISYTYPINLPNFTRPTLAHPMLRIDVDHQIPIHIGPSPFFGVVACAGWSSGSLVACAMQPPVSSENSVASTSSSPMRASRR